MIPLLKVRNKDGTVKSIAAVAVPSLAAPHAESHKQGGTDPITPESIGAVRMVSGTYVGDGTNGRSLTLEIPAKVLLIMEEADRTAEYCVLGAVLFPAAGAGAYLYDCSIVDNDVGGTLFVNADGLTVSWVNALWEGETGGDEWFVQKVANANLNAADKTYCYVAFG